MSDYAAPAAVRGCLTALSGFLRKLSGGAGHRSFFNMFHIGFLLRVYPGGLA